MGLMARFVDGVGEHLPGCTPDGSAGCLLLQLAMVTF